MKILLVSDTHGNNDCLEQLVNTHPDMDLYLHLGDSESDEYSLMPFRSVMGNRDFYPNFPENLLIPTPFGNLFASHTPYIRDGFFKEKDVKIFCYGHTHMRKYEQRDGMIIINPGAITFARDRYDESYVILTISNDKVDVEFHTLDEITI